MEKSTKRTIWILAGCATVFIVVGGIGITLAMWWVYDYGTGQLEQAVAQDAEVQKILGEIESSEFDLTATNEAEGESLVIRVKGTKGEGRFVGEIVPFGEELRIQGTLILSNGEEHAISGFDDDNDPLDDSSSPEESTEPSSSDGG